MFAFTKAMNVEQPVIDTMLEGKPFRVTLTPAAQQALARRARPLIAEMEFYFSCLIRFRVRFYDEDAEGNATPITPELSVRFRPVMTARCDLHAVEGKPPLTDFPIAKRAPYVPHWLHLDYQKGGFVGNFGYRLVTGKPAARA